MKNPIKQISAIFLSLVLILTAIPICAYAEAEFVLPDDIVLGESLIDLNFANGSVTTLPSGWTDEKPGSNYTGWDTNKSFVKELSSSGLRLASTKCDGIMFLPSYKMTDYVFEVSFVPNTSNGSFGLGLNTASDLSAATGTAKLMAYAKDYGSDAQYLYYQNKYKGAADSTSHKLLREDYGIAVPEAGQTISFKAYVIDGICYWYINDVAIVSFAIEGVLDESRVAIFTCGADVNVTSVKLNKIKGKNRHTP